VNNFSSENELRYGELKVIMKAISALADIETDLIIFSDQLRDDSVDDRTKTAAEVFTKEFVSCRESLETSLLELLEKE